jgi:hypothetical protein
MIGRDRRVGVEMAGCVWREGVVKKVCVVERLRRVTGAKEIVHDICCAVQ